MADLIMKYVNKDEKEDIFHSSPYGRAQNKTSMGVASTETFNDRRKIDRQRKVVRRYDESHIANNGIMNGPHAKPYVPPKANPGTPGRVSGPKY